ncbi:leucine-rich repeat-containing protein 43 [Rana temporaria]|uniref:leucine-rich repeat-containing protein 43 n=1 Tax=Rana temporaria TaxID=8407 RepID=UPI001AADB159|nr:leucine-rich repeat-containing protein 43 [Rana temporaria]
MTGTTVSGALTRQMKTLGLKSFPCAPGSWNKSSALNRKTPCSDCESSDPKEESQDHLKDLLNQHGSPWELDDRCNVEAQHIRELAVTRPEVITEQFIHSYFRSLRVVDQEVTEVDDGLLKFHSLEELVLSANKLQTVCSSNLPRTLKVLELCSNHISSLKALTVNPPPGLQHLGLAYNKIQVSTESKYLTADFWPALVSLDLSFNDLKDLFDLVSRLCTLQKLRILVLQGNPLTFIPAYRGYTIDSIKKLCVLDDISILPDEKHKYDGLCNQKESMTNKAKLFVHIGKVQGIPNPSIVTEQHNASEYPIITFNYRIYYEFIEDREELPESQPERYQNQQLTTPEEGVTLLNSPTSHFHTGLCKSDGLPWSEVIDYEYTKEHTITDLVLLKSFLLSGTTVSLIEEKILSWPPDSDHDQGAAVPKLDKKAGGKDKEKDKARSSSRGSKAGSKSKKKKENVDDLRHDPPVVRTLGSVVMPLESLVSGEGQTYHVCNFGILITDPEQHGNDKAPHDGKKHKEQKLKSGLESTETHKTPHSSAKEKHKDSTIKSTEDEPQSAAMPVTAAITVSFLH